MAHFAKINSDTNIVVDVNVANNSDIRNINVRSGTHLTPCHPKLLRDQSPSDDSLATSVLPKTEQTVFASKLMSAMFPAKRTRPEVLMPLA